MNWNTTFGFRQTLSFFLASNDERCNDFRSLCLVQRCHKSNIPIPQNKQYRYLSLSLYLSIYLSIYPTVYSPINNMPTAYICKNFHHLSNQSQLVTWVHELPHPMASPVPVLSPWEAVLNPVLGWTRLQQQQPWMSMWDVHGRSHLQHGFNPFPKDYFIKS